MVLLESLMDCISCLPLSDGKSIIPQRSWRCGSSRWKQSEVFLGGICSWKNCFWIIANYWDTFVMEVYIDREKSSSSYSKSQKYATLVYTAWKRDQAELLSQNIDNSPSDKWYRWWEEQCLKKAGEKRKVESFAHCRSRVCINGLTWSCKKEFHSFQYLRGGEGIPANWWLKPVMVAWYEGWILGGL